MFVGVSTALTAVRSVLKKFVRQGLKLYYRFSDTESDFLLDGSAFFDDTNDYISLSSVSPSGTWSISFWFNSTIEDNGAIYTNVDGASNYISIGMWDGKIQMNCADTGGTGRSTTSTYNDGEWHHAVLIKKDTSICSAIYIDGELASSNNSNSWAGTNTRNEHTIGRAQYSTEQYYGGRIASLGLWNRELSVSEIESIHWRGKHSELQSTELTNLVSWYDLDSTSLGSELVVNGTFDSDLSGWTQTNLTATYDSGTAVITNQETANDEFLQAVSLDEGVGYEVSATISNYSAGTSTVVLRYDNTALTSGGSGGDRVLGTVDGNKTITATIYGTSGSEVLRFRCTSTGSATNYTIDNVSVKAIQTPDAQGSNEGNIVGATVNSDSYSGESPFKPRIQDKATPKMAVQLADGSTSFDGTDDFIDLSNVSNFANLTQGTISAWFKTPDLASYRTLISGSDRSDGSSECILIITNTGKIRYVNQENASVAIEVDTNSAFDDNEWHHVALTVDGTGNKIYVDGSLQSVTYVNGSASTQKFFNDVNDIDSLKIGANEDVVGTESFFNGSMANVAIHSSALTQTQIQELMFTERYQNLSADLKTNLVSWYDLGDESLGSEKVSNGTFDTDTTGWAGVSGGNVTYDSTNQRLINTPDSNFGSARQFMTGFVDGAKYKATWTQEEGNGLALEGGSGPTWDINGLTYYYPTPSGQQDFTAYFNSVLTGNVTLKFVVQGEVGYLDNMSIKQVFAPDSHGSNTGTPYGAISSSGYTSSPHGVVDPLNFGEVYSGRALDFDGSNDYVDCGDGTSLDITSNLSMSFWVKFDSGSATQFLMGRDDDSNRNFELGISSNKLFWSIYSGGSAKGGGGLGNTLSDGVWYHIAVNYDGSNLKTYVDGLLTSTTAGTGAIDNDNVSFTIGAREGGMDRHFNGKMSSVKVFNTALTQDQVRELYTKPETVLPTGVSASNLKLDLPMQEGSGSYIYDGSGNQNHGTITGATWVTGQEYGYQSSLVRSNTPMIFDGANDYIDCVTTNMFQNATNMSISAWVFPTHPASSGSTYYSIINQFDSPSAKSWGVWLHAPDNSTDAHIHFNDNTSAFDTTSAIVPIGVWSHIVLTRDGTSIKMYFNGSLNHSATSGASANANFSTKLSIGAQNASNPAAFFIGVLNEISLHDITLDADAVTQLYNSGVPLLPTSDSGNYDNSDSLVGYWRNDGITTWTDRANTGVASFDNTDDYIAKTSATGIPTDYPITLSAWFKTGASTTGISDAIFGVYNPSSANNWLAIGIENGGIRAWIRTNSGTNANPQGSGYDDGNWHHAVVVYTSDTNRKVYVDGSLISTITDGIGATTYPSSLSVISIGRHGDASPSEYFDGQIAGCNIFNVALSATEVSELYAIDKRSSISGHSQFSNCVASYLMGAGTGDTASTIQDQTSNNNDGTVDGASLIGYNDGTAYGSPVSIVIPEGSTEGRDNQGYYLLDTTTISNGIRLHGTEYIEIQDSEVLSFGDGINDRPFSLEAWVKMKDASSFMIFTKGAYNVNAEYNLYTDSFDKLNLTIYDESLSATYQGRKYNTALTSFEGQWIHVVATYDGTGGTNAQNGINLYINGSVVDDTDVSNGSYVSMENLGADFYIGKDGTTFPKGSIDEARVYSKELSASEILKNYNSGKSSHQ